MQNFVYIQLKIRKNIHQFKRHDFMLITFESTFERCFLFVFVFNANSMKNISNVQFCEHLNFRKFIQIFIYEKKTNNDF